MKIDLRKRGLQKSGQTLLLFVFFMIMLIVFVGLGIDLGFAYITRARLSKAVDAACLAGIRAYKSDNVPGAEDRANSIFQANYPQSGLDAGTITRSLDWGNVNNNVTLDITANTRINTFFIRVVPALFAASDSWRTLGVASSAQATRPNLIMSLVMDVSGSMSGNGGAAALPPAVVNFIELFDDVQDRVAMSSFSSGSFNDVTMRKPFIQDIQDAANAMSFHGWTVSERGLTNGLAQQHTVTPMSGEKVVRVIVFFTDGIANTWHHTFNCGPRTIGPDGSLWDPTQQETPDNSGCSVPSSLPSIDPQTGGLTPNAVDSDDCDQMHFEAQRRAERIAWLARNEGITIYSIGMGSPGRPGECEDRFPVLNPAFLKNVANTPDSSTHVNGQPEGDYAIAENSGELDRAFQLIANKILARLSK